MTNRKLIKKQLYLDVIKILKKINKLSERMEDVIIIGAGLAGLGCAKRLYENKQRFKIITEDIGGRVKTSPDGETNYGAYYMTADCKNIRPYVTKTGRVRFSHSHLHNEEDHYHVFSPKILKHVPAGLKLIKDLYFFRKHLLKFRRDSLNHSRQELIEADPLMRKYYHQKASEYITESGLEDLTKKYLEQFLWASFFIDPRKVPTALFLGSLQPLLVPSYTFKFNFDKLIKGFKKEIIIDSVKKIKNNGNHFVLKTKSSKIYQCKKLVIATPMSITNNLIKPQKIKGGINVSYYHLKGEIRAPYDAKWYNFFSVNETTAISREPNGTYLYFYGGKNKVKKYFKKYTIIAHNSWKPALYFLGDEYVNLNPEPNLFLATDHDVPGMEDAFINGHYTAKLVLKSLKVKNKIKP